MSAAEGVVWQRQKELGSNPSSSLVAGVFGSLYFSSVKWIL